MLSPNMNRRKLSSCYISLIMPDLRRFEKLYDQFDAGHGQEHIQRVRDQALKLARKYLPDKLELVYIAATMHDIGLIHGRENHEENGAKMALEDKQLAEDLTPTELLEVAEAIREHRASSGNPKSTLAKIISDADKASDTSAQALKRAYAYGQKNFPDLSHEEQLWRCGTHLLEKFGPGAADAPISLK